MQKTGSLSLSAPPHPPDVTMDYRDKPGGDDHRGLYETIYMTRSFNPSCPHLLRAATSVACK
jgi:hypothetical protein